MKPERYEFGNYNVSLNPKNGSKFNTYHTITIHSKTPITSEHKERIFILFKESDLYEASASLYYNMHGIIYLFDDPIDNKKFNNTISEILLAVSIEFDTKID